MSCKMIGLFILRRSNYYYFCFTF